MGVLSWGWVFCFKFFLPGEGALRALGGEAGAKTAWSTKIHKKKSKGEVGIWTMNVLNLASLLNKKLG